MTIPTREAIAASHARVLVAERLPAALHCSTDTRTLAPGDAYVALRGATYDGHAFTAAALRAGASALVVDAAGAAAGAVPDGASALVVDDTTRAYLAFAGVARGQSGARVVAITGSAGKTTTKALLAQILERVAPGRVAATPANENNEIGVAKLLLSLAPDDAYVVVECGARHPGDIEPLVRVARPAVAVLTNIGEAHLEIFGSAEALAHTKWGIFATGAHAVLNAACVVSRERSMALERGVTWFAAGDGVQRAPSVPSDAFVRLLQRDGQWQLSVRPASVVPREALAEETYPCDVTLAGAHNVENLAAAIAAALALGLPAERVVASLGTLALPPGRYERSAVAGFDVIYDAYNASTSGTLATLASFAREAAGRRIAVLGSMAELGPDAASMHVRVGEAAANSGLSALLVGGDFAADLARGARDGGLAAAAIVPFADNSAATAWLRHNAKPGDLVLLKASRRYRLEEIVAGLRATHADV